MNLLTLLQTPSQASSRIIGRGGAFIKQLQRESGCKINTLKDVDLRSGLKARVMNVCGNNTAMSKGLYLITRKIASRWEYASEWEGGDPTVDKGMGMPSTLSAGGQSGGGGGSRGSADHASNFDGMDVDGNHRRQRGGQRSRGSRSDRDDDQDSRGGSSRYDRDGDSRDRRDRSGGAGDRSSGSGRDSRYGRSGRDSAAPAPSSSRSQAPVPAPVSPWTDAAVLASVVGGAAGGVPVASAEAWQRLLGQIPTSARESLGIGAPVAPGTTDVYGQLMSAGGAVQQQLPQQPPQVRLFSVFCVCVRVSFFRATRPVPSRPHARVLFVSFL